MKGHTSRQTNITTVLLTKSLKLYVVFIIYRTAQIFTELLFLLTNQVIFLCNIILIMVNMIVIIVEQRHGNSKRNTSSHRWSKESLKEKIKNSKYGPKETVHRLLEDAGGILEVHSPSDFPKNRQQIKNLKRKSDNNLKDDIVNLIDTCNKEHELKNIFVRTVLPSPEKIVFLSSENQLNDINRFCTNNARFCILGIDPTYNVSLCYLTVTTYRHLHFRTNKREHLVKIGPVLIHTRKEYSSYFHLPCLMLQAQPTLKNIKVVEIDSEKNVYLPFKTLCQIHIHSCVTSTWKTF